jgi:hypothetical protein
VGPSDDDGWNVSELVNVADGLIHKNEPVRSRVRLPEKPARVRARAADNASGAEKLNVADAEISAVGSMRLAKVKKATAEP